MCALDFPRRKERSTRKAQRASRETCSKQNERTKRKREEEAKSYDPCSLIRRENTPTNRGMSRLSLPKAQRMDSFVGARAVNRRPVWND